MIEEGNKSKYAPQDLEGLCDAVASIEGRTKLLNEALFELGWLRWTKRIARPRTATSLGPLPDK